MNICTNIKEFIKPAHAVVTMGTFDGLHLGHQKIIEKVKQVAHEKNGETIVVTFDPHPRHVIENNADGLKFILTKRRKFDLLATMGVDHLIIIPFDRQFAQISPAAFITDYLVEKVGVKDLIIGYDHRFGKDRVGSLNLLTKLGEQYGFNVERVGAQFLHGVTISSTKIRKALKEGDIRLANQMLGYEYSITGKVVVGNRIGHSLGFPTANIECHSQYKLIAAGGVYTCRVEWRGKLFYGMGNIGFRPTIGDSDLVTEVHIFDFDKDIYGEEITVYFVDRIRDEIKFGSLEDLSKQLNRDRIRVKDFFDNEK